MKIDFPTSNLKQMH